MAARLPFFFNVSTKTITRAVTRINRNQFENREEWIKVVAEGLNVVALLRSIVSLIPQVGSLLSRKCGASNQSLDTSLSSIPRVALSAGLSLLGMCFDCSALLKSVFHQQVMRLRIKQ